jgi:hypothetical protein
MGVDPRLWRWIAAHGFTLAQVGNQKREREKREERERYIYIMIYIYKTNRQIDI